MKKIFQIIVSILMALGLITLLVGICIGNRLMADVAICVVMLIYIPTRMLCDNYYFKER